MQEADVLLQPPFTGQTDNAQKVRALQLRVEELGRRLRPTDAEPARKDTSPEASFLIAPPALSMLARTRMKRSLPLLMFGFVWWLTFPIQLLFRVIQDFQPPVDGD